MDDSTHNKDPRELGTPGYNREGTSDFRISRQTDGSWEVEYSLGKHRRIYQSLIDATEGALAAAASDDGPYSIRITR
jgi:hypothetical protein